MDGIDQLQKQLQERIEALDKQRKEEALRFEEEVAKRNAEEEQERKERSEAHHKKEEEHRKRKQLELEEIENQKRETFLKQKEAEQNSNAALEAKKQQEEKLEWLRAEISKQEFIEEQHRKVLQNRRAVKVTVHEPEGLGPGSEAAAGTDGSTPETPLMSQHLKNILRQANRTY